MDDIPCSDSCEARNCKTYSLVKYDFIEYNGTVYYRTDEKVDKLKDKARPIDVYLLEYDKKHHNECLYTAYPFMNDPDMIYIIFEDRIYTKDSDLASDYYTSYDFLKKFNKLFILFFIHYICKSKIFIYIVIICCTVVINKFVCVCSLAYCRTT